MSITRPNWKSFCFFLIIFMISCSPKNVLIQDILKKNDFLSQVSKNPKYEVQIIYTHVDLKDTTFTRHTFKVDQSQYFYPASTIKLPIAILSLQKINELRKNNVLISIHDDMLSGAEGHHQTLAIQDSTNTSGKPSIGRYIEKIFAVSDNDASNRLYEFLGQDYLNENIINKGFSKKSVICHRVGVSEFSFEDNRNTNPIYFYKNQKLLYKQGVQKSKKPYLHTAKNAVKGKGFINGNDSLVMQAFDFSKKNFYPIEDLESTLMKIIFPQKFMPNERFNLKDEDYTFLKNSMSALPKAYPFYKNDKEYYDSYVKFFIFGTSKNPMPDDIKIYNKVGNAYGYLIDCAYIENKSKNIGFFLTAVIHVNEDQIYNDGKYEYDEIGYPFFTDLGQSVLNYEIALKK
jgi:Beta-lactamase enzyme family